MMEEWKEYNYRLYDEVHCQNINLPINFFVHDEGM